MNKLFIISILFLLFPLVANSQCILTIEISSLQNNSGEVLLELSDEKEKTIGGYKGSIVEKKCTIIIESLNPGKYAFRYFHDENKNKKLDTNWIGIPNEGYGFSNNAEGSFGPPSFDEMVFEISKDKTVKCIAYYF